MPAFTPIMAESLSKAQVQSLQSLKSLGKCNGEEEMLNKDYPKMYLSHDASPTASCFSWTTPQANSHK